MQPNSLTRCCVPALNSRHEASVTFRYGLVGAANGTLVPPSTLVAQLVPLPLVPAGVVGVVQQLSAELPGIRTGQPLICGLVATQLANGWLGNSSSVDAPYLRIGSHPPPFRSTGGSPSTSQPECMIPK